MHIHDALKSKNHLAPGSGEIQLNKLMELTSLYVESIIFETKTVDGLQ